MVSSFQPTLSSSLGIFELMMVEVGCGRDFFWH